MFGLIPRIKDSEVMHPRWDVFDRFFEDFNLPTIFAEEKEWVPSFDISEKDDNIIVKAEEVNATYNNGVLKLVLPKAETEKVRKVEIKQ